MFPGHWQEAGNCTIIVTSTYECWMLQNIKYIPFQNPYTVHNKKFLHLAWKIL